MPSPLGHAMAGAAVAWIAETRQQRSSGPVPGKRISPSFLDRLAGTVTPLTVACAVLAISPDFDVFFHTHRTYSHSLGAAGIVWLLGAFVAWRLRLPVVRTATTCAAAYASHILLDWLGRDKGGGLMAFWPLTHHFYISGLNLFREIGGSPRAVVHHPAIGFLRALFENRGEIVRELVIVGPLFLLVLRQRLRAELGPRPGVPAWHSAAARNRWRPPVEAPKGLPLQRPARNHRA